MRVTGRPIWKISTWLVKVRCAVWDGIALFDDRDAVKDAAVGDGAEKFDVFGVGPDKRLRGAGGAAEVHALGGDVGVVPDLLGQHASDGAEALEGSDVVADVAAGGKLVVGAFAGQERPGAALSPAVVGAAVFALAVAVVVVAAPAGAEGGVDLESSGRRP